MTSRIQVFISYSRQDKSLVENIAQILTESGISAWFDHELLQGQNWKNILSNAISTSHSFIYILSPDSIHSNWCLWEFGEALKYNKPIFPIWVRKGNPPVKLPAELNVLNDIHQIDLSNGISRTQERKLIGGIYSAQPIATLPKIPNIELSPDFMNEQPAQSKIGYKVGMKIYHPTFGEGFIIKDQLANTDSESALVVTVAFLNPKFNIKMLDIRYAKLTILALPPQYGITNSLYQEGLSEYSEYVEGLKVKHPSFGDGIIIDTKYLYKGEIKVAFENKEHGIKNLDMKFAVLKIHNTEN